MKKKILFSVATFFALHALTWWVWGDKMLLKKGFSKLEQNSGCSDQFKGLARIDIYDGVEYTYTSERLYINGIPRTNDADSVSSIEINGEERKVFGYRKNLLNKLSNDMDSTNTIYQLFIVHEEWIFSNPYFQDAAFTCWVLGSDIDDGHEPLLVWGFFGWIDISNEYLYQFYHDNYVKYRMEKERNSSR